MYLYVAGKMRGVPLFNFPAFDAKRDELQTLGHNVISPADLDREAGDVNPETMTAPSFAECMRRDIKALLMVDGIVFLEGWQESEGAGIEHVVGKALDLLLFYPGDEVPRV